MSENTSGLLRRAYEPYYAGGHKNDSPDRSRELMAQRLAGYVMQNIDTSPVILDVGAGGQSVERLLRMYANNARKGKYETLQAGLQSARFMTLDIAAKPARKQRVAWAQHVNADAASLPIADGAVNLLVSNHAVDMLRHDRAAFPGVLAELNRVLSPGGKMYFQFHHANLFGTLCEYYQARGGPQREYYDPRLPNPFYGDAETIREELAQIAPQGVGVTLESQGEDQWWCVDVYKPPVEPDS